MTKLHMEERERVARDKVASVTKCVCVCERAGGKAVRQRIACVTKLCTCAIKLWMTKRGQSSV